MTPKLSMRDSLDEPDLFGKVLVGQSWDAWRVWLISLMGEPLVTEDERRIFRELTGRHTSPRERVDEAVAISGRQSGKTRCAAILGAYTAALCDWRDELAPGERALLPILSASTKQASRCFNFLSGVFHAVPALKALVENETADTISLSTGVDIEVRTASWRTIRGAKCVACICDEVAFWRSEETSRNLDKEVLDAVRPSLAMTGGLMALISSPYGKTGELWNAFKRDYGPDGDPLVLVGRAASIVMNPTLSKKVIRRAYERDAQVAKTEYGGEFRDDLTGYVDAEAIEAAVARGVVVRAPVAGVFYVAGCDPSGGSSDSMTISVAHGEGDRLVQDLVAERRAPFSPESVVSEFSATLKQYRCFTVRGDRYAGEWPREAFARHGITYEPAELSKSEAYLAFLPLLNSGRVSLVDSARMISQFASLERRTARGGHDSVDHPRGAHDDCANAAALAILAVSADGIGICELVHQLKMRIGGGFMRGRALGVGALRRAESEPLSFFRVRGRGG
jgi:hypothetical protein